MSKRQEIISNVECFTLLDLKVLPGDKPIIQPNEATVFRESRFYSTATALNFGLHKSKIQIF